MTPAEILTKAADLLEKPGAWTQGHSARGLDGYPRDPNDPEATSWCAIGAVCAVVDCNFDAARPAWRVIDSVLGDPDTAFWNDAPERTQAEVVAKLREAAELARAGAA